MAGGSSVATGLLFDPDPAGVNRDQYGPADVGYIVGLFEDDAGTRLTIPDPELDEYFAADASALHPGGRHDELSLGGALELVPRVALGELEQRLEVLGLLQVLQRDEVVSLRVIVQLRIGTRPDEGQELLGPPRRIRDGRDLLDAVVVLAILPVRDRLLLGGRRTDPGAQHERDDDPAEPDRHGLTSSACSVSTTTCPRWSILKCPRGALNLCRAGSI